MLTDDEKRELITEARSETCGKRYTAKEAKSLALALADALEGTRTEPEWRTVVLGREEATDSDSNWQVTAWTPAEVDEARIRFPRSEYKLARMALDEEEVVNDDGERANNGDESRQ
ncbi:hypothetical protein [Leucobacter sp. NPDC077196]|uniref:hypothetical protein n=1 Tax=Leucobacter sp. NPDC077196 TaxID=3154959 RepID=UPI0034430A68